MDRYHAYIIDDYNWEAVIYFSDELFEPENYNEKSITRESKIAFR